MFSPPRPFCVHRIRTYDRKIRSAVEDGSKTPGVAALRDVPARAVMVYRLVQPASAAYHHRRQDTGGSLPPTAAGESKSSLRASCPLASACPLCLASGAGQGTARSADRTGGKLPAETQAPASRHHPPRRVSGISGESLTEQHPVSLRRSLQGLASGIHSGRGTPSSTVPSHGRAMPSPLPRVTNRPEFDRRISPD